ncbi:CSMT1 protein, partial [Polyodon spathula]|nr:CSMT1 protein [Polyodon spathula]
MHPDTRSTAQISRRSETLNDEKDPGPVQFTSSKASHRSWPVDQSLGSQFQKPWWKVLPVSLIGLLAVGGRQRAGERSVPTVRIAAARTN